MCWVGEQMGLTHQSRGMAGESTAFRIMLTNAKVQYKIAATPTRPFSLFWTCVDTQDFT